MRVPTKSTPRWPADAYGLARLGGGALVALLGRVGLVAGRPEPAADLAAGTAVPPYASRYRRAVAH